MLYKYYKYYIQKVEVNKNYVYLSNLIVVIKQAWNPGTVEKRIANCDGRADGIDGTDGTDRVGSQVGR